MAELKKWDTKPMIRCENEKCCQLSTVLELKRNNWKCPYCGKPISKPE